VPCPGCQAAHAVADLFPVRRWAGSTTEEGPLSEKTDLGKYALVEQVGEGGMGVILRVHEPVLNRHLALKVLRDEYRERPEMVRRFVEEAQIAGQLQHPAVVPVHELGTLPDGRPFFAMKLIKGQTLARLLAERAGPAESLPRYLAVFEQVCQALAYVHARRVIHRDLKPANVMVGAFGEVQVMDWGLAKVLPAGAAGPGEEGRPDGPAVSVVETVGSATGERATQAGWVLGTLAYMPPEQARGEVERIDERADVFGLGAILCEVLTGQPPYAGSVAEVRAQAQLGHLQPAHERLDGCGADGNLVRLAKTCLAPCPEERPRAGGAVAEAVSAYLRGLQERLRAAEVERAAAAARAAAERQAKEAAQARAQSERRARRLTVALAAAMLATVVLGGLGTWYLAEQAAAQRRGVEATLAEVGRLQQQARWAEARVALDQAQSRLAEGGQESLRARLERARRELDLVDRLDAIRLKRATLVEGRFDLAGADREYEEAFGAAGLAAVGGDTREAAAWVKGTSVHEALVAALDDWAACAPDKPRRDWLLEVARWADSDPWRDRARDPAVWDDAAALARLTGEKQVAQQSPQLLAALSVTLQRGEGDAEGLLRRAQARHPGDFWINFGLANALGKHKKPAEAEGYYRAALAVRPATPAVYNNLGNVLHDLGKAEEAAAAYLKAITLDRKLAPPHYNLGSVLADRGKLPEAAAAYRQALALAPKHAKAHYHLGDVLRKQGQREEAAAEFRRTIDLDPKDADAHYFLARVLREQGRWEEAAAEFRRASALAPKLAAAHNDLGLILHDQGKLPEAAAEFRRAIDIDPKDARAHHNLGGALHEQGRREEAAAEFRRAIDLDPKLAGPHNGLGLILSEKGQLPEAAAEFRQAIALDPKLARPHHNLGKILGKQGKAEEAAAEFRQAIALDPTDADAHYNLGNALYHQGQWDDAAAAYRQALRLKEDFAEAHCNLGVILQRQGKLREALAELRRGDELGSGRPGWPYPSKEWVRQCQRLLDLDARLADILAGKARPVGAAEQVEFAGLCALKKRYAEASRFYAEAFAAKTHLADDLRAGHRYNAACYAALAAAGQGEHPGKLDETEQARWRHRALAWLRDDLAAWTKVIETGPPQARATMQGKLKHWQADSDLAGVRDKAALQKLPAQEQEDWRRFWQEVAALRDRAAKQP
jgi:serine/threonine-protein kinase